MFKKLLRFVSPQDDRDRDAIVYRNILRDEAKMGGEVFGPIPAGRRREFFCLDEYTWVWHEEWIDQAGQQQVRTTRYDVRPHGIYKAQDNQPYQPISNEEAKRFFAATREYHRRFHDKFDALLAQAGV